jgi:hypothetical protein
MARTLLDTAQDLLTHIRLTHKGLGPRPLSVETQVEIDLANQHRYLDTIEADLIEFIEAWDELIAETGDLTAPTDEEVRTAIQSITGGTNGS